MSLQMATPQQLPNFPSTVNNIGFGSTHGTFLRFDSGRVLMILGRPFTLAQHEAADESGCVMIIGSAPCFASHSRISGVAKVRAMSFASLSTTPAGVPAGTHTPYQIGNRSRRRRLPRSSALRAARTSASWWLRPGRGACPHGSRPGRSGWAPSGNGAPCDRMAIASAIASPGRAGTCTALMPASRLNFSAPRCVPVPRPRNQTSSHPPSLSPPQ